MEKFKVKDSSQERNVVGLVDGEHCIDLRIGETIVAQITETELCVYHKALDRFGLKGKVV